MYNVCTYHIKQGDCRFHFGYSAVLITADVHVHVGAMGVDFSSFENDSAAERGIKLVAKRLLEHGVTGFCPTLVTGLPEYYQRVSVLAHH